MALSQYDWYILGVVICLTLVSFISRSSYFLFGDHLPLPERVRSALRYAPVAALTAIIIPEIFPWSAEGAPSLDLNKLFAATVAVLVYLRTQSTVFLMIAGIAVYALGKVVF